MGFRVANNAPLVRRKGRHNSLRNMLRCLSVCKICCRLIAMKAEIRTIGNRLAVYTDDQHIYRRLKESLPPLYKVPYLKGGKMVGVDLYFDLKFRNTVARVVDGQFLLDI